MAMFENFPYTDLHNLNLDWIIKQFKVLEQSTVLSVNGQTGQVVLYQSKNVELPSVPEDNWTIVRLTDGTMRGIYFGRDNIAYVVHGNDLEAIYSANNQPPYPVTSVNDKTGTVSLFTDNDGTVEFPSVTDEQIASWMIQRNINGNTVGIEITEAGNINLVVNDVPYTIYTENNPPAGFVANDTTAIMQTTEDISGYIWGLIRETDNGTVGFIFNNTDNTDPDMFIRYTDNNNQVQTLRLLTEGDIPSTGVYNINGKSGVVTIYGSDCDMSSTDNRTIPQAIEDVKSCIAFIENTDIAVNNIGEGEFVIWKNSLYKCTNTIVVGDTLSLSNLSPVNTGGINDLYNMIKTINTKLSSMFIQRTYTASQPYSISPGQSLTYSVADFGITQIPGYTPCAIKGFNSGNSKCSIERVETFYVSGSILVIENTSDSVQTGTPSIKFLFVLEDMLS